MKTDTTVSELFHNGYNTVIYAMIICLVQNGGKTVSESISVF